ncbi:MAG: ion channel [Myxococcota bacterium]
MNGFLFGFALVLLCVGVHYEGLRVCSRLLRGLELHRIGVAVAMIGALIAHMVEVLVFALGGRLIDELGAGRLEPAAANLEDHVYFAAVSYTSLGYGDVVPVGAMREVSWMAALTGLAMIAWTASFGFFQMERLWNER